MGRTATGAVQQEAEADERPLSRLDAAIAKGQSLELEPMARPVRRGGQEADKLLTLGGRVLGEVSETGRGYMAFDEAREAWVGPYKRLADLARFFLGPDEQQPGRPPVVIGVPTKKRRKPLSMWVDLVPKK